MTRKIRKESPKKQTLREMMSVILEAALNGELGYSRYDYRNKDTQNSGNGYSRKTMHTSHRDMELEVPSGTGIEILNLR